MRYRFAAGVAIRGSGHGDFLLADRPLRAVRLNPSLRALVEPCEGMSLEAKSPGEVRALEELARRGFLTRERALGVPAESLPTVSVVVPVKDRAEELDRCLWSLQHLRYPEHKLEVIVVDDGSRDGSASVARSRGATVVPSGGAGVGPAASRNRGAQSARGDILAFVDSDCTVDETWIEELVGAFEDPAVAAVGGRVDGMRDASALDRYEAAMSSLFLGERERCGGEGNDTFYLPSCNLLVRKNAFLDAGGFREGQHVGEDVDLTWRLRDRGWKIQYTPRGRVFHEHRNRLKTFLKRRFEYGTSEAILQIRHPRRRKKIALPPALASVVALVGVGVLGGGWPWIAVAAAVFLADAARVHGRFRRTGLALPWGRILGARTRTLGSLIYYLGYHGFRYYGVPILLLAAAWPVFGLVAAAVLLGVGAMDHHVKGPRLSLPVFLLFYGADQLAYGVGVFWGCVRQRSFATYRPVIYRRMEMVSG